MTAIILLQRDYFSWNNTWFINIKLQFLIHDFYKVWCVGIQIYLHPSSFPSIWGWKHDGVRNWIIYKIWLGLKKIILMQRWINRRIDYVYIYWFNAVNYFDIIFFNTLSSSIEIRKLQTIFSNREWRNSDSKSWNY